MTTNLYRAMCAELIKIVEEHCNLDDYALLYAVNTLRRARTLLDQPEAEGLTDEELLHIWQFNFSKTNRTRFLDIARAAIAADRASR